jgi:predicted phage terminase large subunit-like protein
MGVMSTPSEIRKELAFRELARRRLAYFVRYWFHARQRQLAWNWHLDYLCDILEAVQRREIPRLLINIPPRFLKSELVCVAWHAWMVGYDDSPRSAMLSAAATASLALRDSRRTLEMLQSAWYRNIFPGVKLMKEAQAEWVTVGGASRNAAGRGGTITGLGGDHLAWDDLLLASESNSEVKRQQAIDFLDETLPSRHNTKPGTITGIMQRLHEEDPTGHILKRMRNPDADQYLHIVLPNQAPVVTTVEWKGKVYARRKVGDLLFPARLDAKATAEARATMRNNYDGQYQQQPTKQEGAELNTKFLVEIDKPAELIVKEQGLSLNFYIDIASTEKQTQKDDPDSSVIAVMGRDTLDRIIMPDMWAEQARGDKLLDQLLIMWKKWKPRRVKMEKGGLKNMFEPLLQARWRAIGQRLFVVDPLEPDMDKVRRAQPLRAVLQAGSFCVPAGAIWLPAMKAEWRGFPNASHDDRVDAPAYGVRDLQDMRAPEPPTKIHGFNHGGEVTGAQLEMLVAKAEKRRKAEERDRFWGG